MKNQTLLILFGFILLLIGFYWFQVRPSMARQYCQKLTYERGNDYFNYKFIQDETPLRKSQLQEEYMERTYARCLREKGIKQ